MSPKRVPRALPWAELLRPAMGRKTPYVRLFRVLAWRWPIRSQGVALGLNCCGPDRRKPRTFRLFRVCPEVANTQGYPGLCCPADLAFGMSLLRGQTCSGTPRTRKRAGQGNAISRPAASNSTPTPREVLMLRLQFDVPKGQSQISPGQRPGNTFRSQSRALTGRNRIRIFTGDCDVAIAENCGALRARASSESRLPGRCPGLQRKCPFGARSPCSRNRPLS